MQIEKIKIGNVNQATIADREKINEIIDFLEFHIIIKEIVWFVIGILIGFIIMAKFIATF